MDTENRSFFSFFDRTESFHDYSNAQRNRQRKKYSQTQSKELLQNIAVIWTVIMSITRIVKTFKVLQQTLFFSEFDFYIYAKASKEKKKFHRKWNGFVLKSSYVVKMLIRSLAINAIRSHKHIYIQTLCAWVEDFPRFEWEEEKKI